MIDAQHVVAALDVLTDPIACEGCNRYYIAHICSQSKELLESGVFCLTRSGEQGILGVYRTRELAEKAANQCFDPSEMRIEGFPVLDEVEE